MGSAAGSCRRLGWLAGRQRGVRTLIPTFAVSPGGRWETLLETPGHPGRSPARTGCSRSRTGGTAGAGPTRVSLANGPAEKGSDANPFTRPRTPFHCRRTSGPACDGRDRTGPSGERPGRIKRATDADPPGPDPGCSPLVVPRRPGRRPTGGAADSRRPVGRPRAGAARAASRAGAAGRAVGVLNHGWTRIKDAGPGGLSSRVRPRRRGLRNPVRSVPFAQTHPGPDQALDGSNPSEQSMKSLLQRITRLCPVRQAC